MTKWSIQNQLWAIKNGGASYDAEWAIMDDANSTYEKYQVVMLTDAQNDMLLGKDRLKLSCGDDRFNKWKDLSDEIVRERGHNGDIYIARSFERPPTKVIATKVFYVSGHADAQNHIKGENLRMERQGRSTIS